ncbi:MAG: hypothetical protein CBD74_05675 [Saprospirales bacterium TMED214]|nr:MAG: hypothetical protein CBD74_05675 [Saprospirales bacterium TMED214]
MPTSPTPILTLVDDDVNATAGKPMKTPRLQRVCGVDFSGAINSGKTAWLAELEADWSSGTLQLVQLASLGKLAGSDERTEVCRYLAEQISSSRATLWAMDFPFGLPLELGGEDWNSQLEMIANFESQDGGGNLAAVFGRQLSVTARQIIPSGRLRRKTDVETSTPFDSYHYRIIYQTFHGMRDVLLPISKSGETAVIPFQYHRLSSARRIVVESCPASFLKRWNLPHSRYKQSGGKPPTTVHRSKRLEILRGINDLPTIRPAKDGSCNQKSRKKSDFSSKAEDQEVPCALGMSRHRRRVIMQDSGGDALDAVLAGLGGWRAFHCTNHADVLRDTRYCLEGRVYS